MTRHQLKDILQKHQNWLAGDGGKRADLRGVDLSGTDLRGADLRRANLFKPDLRNADLRIADLRGEDLRGADLRGANLGSADLRGADLRNADFTNSRLQDTKIYLVRVGPVPPLAAEAWAYAHDGDIRIRFGSEDQTKDAFLDGVGIGPYRSIFEAACDLVRQKVQADAEG